MLNYSRPFLTESELKGNVGETTTRPGQELFLPKQFNYLFYASQSLLRWFHYRQQQKFTAVVLRTTNRIRELGKVQDMSS